MTIALNSELENLNSKILEMGELVKDSIDKSIDAFLRRDTALAEQVRRGDDAIDKLDIEIDQKAIDMIALMQPVAGDMRFIITAMKLTTDLERIGDKAEKIAKKTIELSREEPMELDIDIAGISGLVQAMLADSINSFVNRDAGLAREVIKNDDKVDELTDQAIEKLLSAMSSNPTIIKRGIKMYSIIRSLERMADHSTNISEMVIYLIEGDIIRHSAETKKPE